MTPLPKTEQVLSDAVRLLKSDFVQLYVEMGYDKISASAAWHNLRTSPSGQKMREQIKSSSINQATSFISDMKEEVKERLEIKKKKEPVIKNESNNNLNQTSMAKGVKKSEQVKALFDQGITDVKEIVEKAGVNKLYAQNLLKKFQGLPSVLDKKPKAEKKEA